MLPPERNAGCSGGFSRVQVLVYRSYTSVPSLLPSPPNTTITSWSVSYAAQRNGLVRGSGNGRMSRQVFVGRSYVHAEEFFRAISRDHCRGRVQRGAAGPVRGP